MQFSEQTFDVRCQHPASSWHHKMCEEIVSFLDGEGIQAQTLLGNSILIALSTTMIGISIRALN